MRNLVVIVADTLRTLESIDSLVLGRDAPFLDNLIRASTTFDRAVSSSPWTIPSHWSLLCGANPWEVGGGYPTRPAAHRRASVARFCGESRGTSFALSQNGMIGGESGPMFDYDFSIGNHAFGVNRIGAEISSVMDLALGVSARKLQEMSAADHSARVARDPPELFRATLSKAAQTVALVTHGIRMSHLGLHRLCALLEEERSSRPTHIFLNLMDVHEPYIRAPALRGTMLEGGCVPTTNLAIHSDSLRNSGVCPKAFHDAYRHAIGNLDKSLRNVFGVLEKGRILDDALVCLVSDHGQSLGENGFFGHSWSLYDEVVRIPAYLWSSGQQHCDKGTSRIRDWVDHRHLHSVLLDQAAEPAKRVELSIREALDRHGPAISYFRGRRLSGFNPARRLPSYERIRLWQNDSNLELYRGGSNSSIQQLTPNSRNSPALESAANRVLQETRLAADELEVAGECSEFPSKLASWGYA